MKVVDLVCAIKKLLLCDTHQLKENCLIMFVIFIRMTMQLMKTNMKKNSKRKHWHFSWLQRKSYFSLICILCSWFGESWKRLRLCSCDLTGMEMESLLIMLQDFTNGLPR